MLHSAGFSSNNNLIISPEHLLIVRSIVFAKLTEKFSVAGVEPSDKDDLMSSPISLPLFFFLMYDLIVDEDHSSEEINHFIFTENPLYSAKSDLRME